MKELNELLQGEFEEVELGIDSPSSNKVVFNGILLSPNYTELVSGHEGIYLTPEGQFLYFTIDTDLDLGHYNVFPDFSSFKNSLEYNMSLFSEVVDIIGYER